MANCIRKCATPHDCEACTAGKATHEPKPSPASEHGGLLCDRCEGRLRQMLAEIQRDLRELHMPESLEPQRTGVRDGSFRSKGAMGSPALIRLEVMTLIAVDGAVDETGLGSVNAVLGGWAAQLRDHVNGWSVDESPGDWDQWWVWLIERFDDLVRWPDVDAAYTSIQQTHRHTRRAVGVEAGASLLGRCLASWTRPGVIPGAEARRVECGEMVWARPGETQVRCRRCGRIYSGVDKLRLLHQAPAD